MFKNKIIVLALAIAIGAAIWAYAKATQDKTGEVQNNNPLIVIAASPEMTALGQNLYGQYCADCHGKNLEGQPNWRIKKADGSLPAPPHDASGHTWHHSDAMNFKYVKFGGQDNKEANFKTAMPPFNEVFSDAEIMAVLSYIKSQWPADIQAKRQGNK